MKKGAAKQELAAEQVEEVREAFSLFDVDSSGAISYKELRACMKALGIKVDKDELKKMILEVDADQSGEIEFPEFLQMMTGKMASNDTKEETMKVYKMFDADGSGNISFAQLKRVAKVRSVCARAAPLRWPRPSRACPSWSRPSRRFLIPLPPLAARPSSRMRLVPLRVCRSWASR